MLLKCKQCGESLIILFSLLTNVSYSQVDSMFIDNNYYYRITIPHDWTWEKIDNPNNPIRLSVTSSDQKNSLTILTFKLDEGNIDLTRLAILLESDAESKNSLGDLVSVNQLKRYGLDVIEKRYERKGFLKTYQTTAEYMSKGKYGYIFVYTSENKDNIWQEAIRQTLIFNFPESSGAKVFRFLVLFGVLIFLYNSIKGASEPFIGKKRFTSGVGSIISLIRNYMKIIQQINEHKKMKIYFSNCKTELNNLEEKVNNQFDQYWNKIKSYASINK